MPKSSLTEIYSTFVAAAVLGAHANTREAGFRQYDVRFMLEIFTNWVSSAEGESSLNIQNNQLARYLDALVRDEFASQLGEKRKPVYRLTRHGLIEVISRLVGKSHFSTREHFFFVYSFVIMYSGRIIDFVREQGKRFPYSLQVELEALLDPVSLLNRQIDHVRQELYLLERRLKDIHSIADMVNARLHAGKSYEEIIEDVDEVGFFGFSTQKRFSQVFEMSTHKQGIWEMKIGNMLRERMLWGPSKSILMSYLSELEDLKEQSPAWLSEYRKQWLEHERESNRLLMDEAEKN